MQGDSVYNLERNSLWCLDSCLLLGGRCHLAGHVTFQYPAPHQLTANFPSSRASGDCCFVFPEFGLKSVWCIISFFKECKFHLLWLVAMFFDCFVTGTILWVNPFEEWLISPNSNPPGTPISPGMTSPHGCHHAHLCLPNTVPHTCVIGLCPQWFFFPESLLHVQCHLSVFRTQSVLFFLWSFFLSLPIQFHFWLRSSSSEILHHWSVPFLGNDFPL